MKVGRDVLIITALAATVLGLGKLQLEAPKTTAVHKTGFELSDNVSPTPVTVLGTIQRVQTRSDGTRVLALQTDDGASVTVYIPPTVDAQVGVSGDRVAITGNQTKAGSIMVADTHGYASMAPSFSSSSGGNSEGKPGVNSEGKPGVNSEGDGSDDQTYPVTNGDDMPPNSRFQTLAQSRFVAKTRGGLYVRLQDPYGRNLFEAFVPSGLGFIPGDGIYWFKGYKNARGVFITEQVTR